MVPVRMLASPRSAQGKWCGWGDGLQGGPWGPQGGVKGESQGGSMEGLLEVGEWGCPNVPLAVTATAMGFVQGGRTFYLC